MYARNGDWTKCLSLAEKQSPKMLPHYLVRGPRINCLECEFYVLWSFRGFLYGCFKKIEGKTPKWMVYNGKPY